jgi:hypothetical protein
MTVSNGRYRIKNQKSGTYFDVPPSGQAHGWQGYAENLNQQWDLQQAHAGYLIKNAGTGKYVNTNGEPRDGCRVVTSDQPRVWEIKQEGGGSAIIAQNTRESIDLDMGKRENGAYINTWGFTCAQQQLWTFEEVSGGHGQQQGQQQQGYQQQPQQQQQGYQQQGQQQQGYQQQGQQQQGYQQQQQQGGYQGPITPGDYYIINCKANNALDLSGGRADEGNEVIGYANSRADNQKWRIQAGQGGYRIMNVASNTYLGFRECRESADVGGYRNAKEFQVQQGPNNSYHFQTVENPNIVLDLTSHNKTVLWTNNNGENQYWRLEKA